MSKYWSSVGPPPHSWARGEDTFMETAGSTAICPHSPGSHLPPRHLHSHQAACLPPPLPDWLPPAPFACPSAETHGPNGKEGPANLNCLPLLTLLLFLLCLLIFDFCLWVGKKLLLTCVLENPCPGEVAHLTLFREIPFPALSTCWNGPGNDSYYLHIRFNHLCNLNIFKLHASHIYYHIGPLHVHYI